MRELIKNDVLQWQFMSCKNINQNNNGLCKSSSDHKLWNMNLNENMIF